MKYKFKKQKNANITRVLTRADWAAEMLRLDRRLTEIIHKMIAYRTLTGPNRPWTDKDVNCGWAELQDELDDAKAQLFLLEK